MRKHLQPGTMKFASRITVCFCVHNNSFRVFFWQQTHFKSHWQGNTDKYPPLQYNELLSWYGLYYFWGRCRKAYRWRKLQQPRNAPYSAMLLWLFVITTETPQLLSAYSSLKQLALVTGRAHMYKSTPWVQVCSTFPALLWSVCDPNLKEPFLNKDGRRKLGNKQLRKNY